MRNVNEAIARRAALKRDGYADVQFELHRRSAFDFEMIENGKRTGVFWRTLTPEQAMRGDGGYLSLDEAWMSCVSKRFPECTVTAPEDCFLTEDAA